MATSTFLLALPPALLAALSTYTGYYSYISITDMQTYEEKTKKAAEWSNIAEEQLSQTRTTEGAGAVAVSSICFSFSIDFGEHSVSKPSLCTGY